MMTRALFALALAINRVATEFFGQVRSNGFAFAVGIRRQIDGVSRLRQLFQAGDDLFLARNDHVLGGKIVVEIDAERLLGQVFDVSERGFDLVARQPRYFWIVFAFAGDSTMTKPFDNGTSILLEASTGSPTGGKSAGAVRS